jgi:flagellar biosynthesis/type III secretory pathway chaperone
VLYVLVDSSENPQTKPYRTPIQEIYASKESILNHMDKIERERELKRQEEALYQDDDESLRTVDKFEHEHNTEDALTSPKMGD